MTIGQVRTEPKRRKPRALLLLALAMSAGLGAIAAAGALTTMPGEEQVANGESRNRSFHVRMKDGTAIAVDIWYPEKLERGTRAPALMHMTRYWRARESSFVQRLLYAGGLLSSDDLVPEHVRIFNARGYVVVEVDARGSGASFGSRVAELAPREIDDYGQIADWLAAQRWSNGRVGAFGISYNGNAAELVLASRTRAIKAVAPQFSDFDFQFGVLQPGGATMNFVPLWDKMVGAMDRNDVCAADGVDGWDCLWARWIKGGVKPVDGPEGPALLTEAIRDHGQNAGIDRAFSRVGFRDDHYGESGLPISSLNSYGHRAAIEASAAPMQVWTGWFDAATTAGALSRFATFSNPQHLIIGPFSHGGAHDTDPFRSDDAPPIRSPREQYELIANFFDRHLKDRTAAVTRGISYYTMGKARWCRTESWPPKDMTGRLFAFGPGHSLSESSPPQGTDNYRVDFSHSSGERNRWMTNLDYGDVVYGDRSRNKARLLAYVSPPMDAETIITGSPRIRISLAADRPQFTIHAYLEGVAPDGRTYHIAEAVLRSENIGLSTQPNPSDIFGSPRSFLRKDASLPASGAVQTVDLALTPVSIALPRGHRLRVALAGADAALFPRHPAQGELNWSLHYGGGRPSTLEVPVEGPGSCHPADPFTTPRR